MSTIDYITYKTMSSPSASRICVYIVYIVYKTGGLHGENTVRGGVHRLSLYR